MLLQFSMSDTVGLGWASRVVKRSGVYGGLKRHAKPVLLEQVIGNKLSQICGLDVQVDMTECKPDNKHLLFAISILYLISNAQLL